MSFKIKDGLRVDTTDVFNSSGVLLVAAPKWITARDLTLDANGDATATFSGVDGSSNVSASLTLKTVNSNVGTYNTVTVNAKGLVTAASNVAYLTAESDTLSSVTTRGASTGVPTITLTSNTPSNSTTSGALVVTGGVGISGNIFVGGNTTISGNLTVNGTTTTVNSTVTTLDDPILTLGGDSAPTADDSKDRGIEFRWHNGSSAKLGFFGFDDSTGKFTFIPDGTNSSETYTGTKGTLDAYLEWGDILSKPETFPPDTHGHALLIGNGTSTTINYVTGEVLNVIGTGGTTVTYNDSTNTITVDSNPGDTYSVSAQDNDATSKIIRLTSSSAVNDDIVLAVAQVTGTNGLTISRTGDTISLAHADTSGQANVSNSGNTFIQSITLDTYGHISSISSTAVDLSAYLTAETDTLQTVTTRGNITTTNLQLNNSAIALGSSATAKTWTQVKTPTNISVNTAVVLDTWALATYRAAKYTVQVTQSTGTTRYHISEILVNHDGTTTYMTNYAVIENAVMPITFSTAVNGANVELRATLTDGASNNGAIIIQRTLFAV